LADAVPKLLEIKAKSKVPIQFQIRVELGDGQELPSSDVIQQINDVLGGIKDELRVR
jgi:hypothetical protein